MSRKLICGFGVVVEVKPSFYDFKRLGIYSGNLAGGGNIPRSVTAILRRVSIRLLDKKIPVGFAGKIPLGIVPLMGDFAAALQCPTLGVIGDGIIAFDGDSEEGGVDFFRGGDRLGGEQQGRGPEHYNYAMSGNDFKRFVHHKILQLAGWEIRNL